VQANYAVISGLDAKTVQPGEIQQPHYLTNFLDIVSTSPLNVIKGFILNDASIVHQKGTKICIFIDREDILYGTLVEKRCFVLCCK